MCAKHRTTQWLLVANQTKPVTRGKLTRAHGKRGMVLPNSKGTLLLMLYPCYKESEGGSLGRNMLDGTCARQVFHGLPAPFISPNINDPPWQSVHTGLPVLQVAVLLSLRLTAGIYWFYIGVFPVYSLKWKIAWKAIGGLYCKHFINSFEYL